MKAKWEKEVRHDAIHFIIYLENDEPNGFLRVPKQLESIVEQSLNEFIRAGMDISKEEAPRITSG